MKEFVHLHVHTEYSLLDGFCKIDNLVQTVKERGWRAVAITDHGNMYGVIKFFEACVSNGIKPIIGSEFYITHDMHSRSNASDTGHIILLAKNNNGYQNLLKLQSYAFLEGRYYKPRIDYDLLEKYSDGIICLSACLAGHIPQAVLRHEYDEADKLAIKLKNIFKDDFYLEIQNHNFPEDKELIPHIVDMGQRLGIKLVATNDAHYINKEDAEIQDILMCVNMGKTYDDPDRLKLGPSEFYLKTYEEMEEILPGFEEAFANTIEIADKCNVSIRTKSLREMAEGGNSNIPQEDQLGAKENFIPAYQPDTGESAFEFLTRISWEGFKRNYSNPPKEYSDRLQFELDTINKLGFVEYFLIVWDYINYARQNNIPVGPGRGSGAGSLVAYCSGITQVDPMKYELYFDRFINPERVSMPDFDVDFCMDRRREVIAYAKRRYGADHVSNIITFGNMQAKNAIKDVARVLRYPYSEVDKITKEIPTSTLKGVLAVYFGLKEDPKKKAEVVPELRKMYEEDEEVRRVVDIAIKLEGIPRQASMHAAGVLIAPDPVYDYVPMAMSGEDVVTQYDMTELEHLGLLKMDFLGLRNLTDIQKAVQYIKENHGIDIDFQKIGYDDPAVYEMISAGKTTAVFQLESGGMTKFMKDLQPTCLEDIIAGISLYRPGPMDFIPKFIKGKKDPEHIEYDDPCLVPILEKTYGCIVYQEQVMKIFQVMGGFSLGGADVVRRIMSKKKPHLLPPEEKKFIYGWEDPDGKRKPIPGAVKLGHDPEVAKKVFDQMAKFAGYAFNKSHAAAYAHISYQTGYLMAHYEVEFLTAYLNNRITNADLIKKYTNFARKDGINILHPDINKSATLFKTEGKDIRFGLGALKGVGTGLVDTIIEERQKNGDFKSFEDFANRVSSQALNKRVVESLILGGAFDCFGIARSKLMAVYEQVLDRASADKKNRASGQISMFGGDFGDVVENINAIDYPNIKEYNKDTLLKYEKEICGMYLSGHPLDDYLNKYDEFDFTSDMLPDTTENEFEGMEGEEEINHAPVDEEESSMAEEPQIKDGQNVVCGGIITEVKKIATKSGNMAFLTIEDLYGNFDAMLFPKMFERYRTHATEDNLVTIRGRISIRSGKAPVVVVENMSSWERVGTEENSTEKKIYLRFDTKDIDICEKVKNIVASYPGNSTIIVKCLSSGQAFAYSAKVMPSNYLINELTGLLGEENVIIK